LFVSNRGCLKKRVGLFDNAFMDCVAAPDLVVFVRLVAEACEQWRHKSLLDEGLTLVGKIQLDQSF
jgi:hypothetical protein